ncbi:MAG: SRPBCC family protein [Phycisphaerales bacterium]
MPGFVITETIDRPRSIVWDAMMDTDCWKQIIEGLDSIERLDEPPTRLGTRFSETRTLERRTETFIVEVTAFEPERCYAASVFYQGAEFRYTYTLEDLIPSRSTRITLEASVIARSWIARTLLRPMLGMALKMMKKHDGSQLERLKQFVESSSTPQPTPASSPDPAGDAPAHA